ncbi:ketosynthase chain-length factor [Actinomadura gamaensis]|uniref:Ketosynthase chain-length factor n=1 Tax=Actinomadura gamaensis TaxID=1763541 RepID=A0ABV9TW85_9ACTN
MRAVVTGLGVAAPNGLGAGAYWAATLAGRSGIRRLTRFDATPYPSTLAGEVDGFDAAEHLPSRLLPQTDSMTRLALVAAQEALSDAGADPAELDEFGMGVVTANAFGGFEFGHRELEKLWSRGPQHVSAYQSFAWFYAVNTGQISIRHGMRGPSGVLVAEQAGGLDALGHARRTVRKGIGLVVTGGVDGALSPWGWAAHLASGELSEDGDPATAYVPFDARARGHVPGEGGAILTVEEREHARRRGAPRAYGEITGYASTFGDGGLRRAIELALADAGIPASGIDVVFADGAADRERDRREAEALVAVFGPYGVPVTVPKTLVGRLASGAGPLDAVAALLAFRDGVIPATPGVRADPGLEVDLVGTPRPARLRRALVIARGHGGFNSALILEGT